MHSTVAFSNKNPLPDSFELKAFMLTLVYLLPSHSFWTENPLPESYVLKRNSSTPLTNIYAYMFLLHVR